MVHRIVHVQLCNTKSINEFCTHFCIGLPLLTGSDYILPALISTNYLRSIRIAMKNIVTAVQVNHMQVPINKLKKKEKRFNVAHVMQNAKCAYIHNYSIRKLHVRVVAVLFIHIQCVHSIAAAIEIFMNASFPN